MQKDRIRRHFEAIANDYDRWKEKSSYYYALLAGIYREIVPEGASVLEVGCGTGTLLASLRPRRGVGIDISARMIEIASARHPGLSFVVADAEALSLPETFEYVIIPDVVEHVVDAGAMFRAVRRCVGPAGRVVVTSVNPRWAPALHLAERLGMKMPEGEHRWLPEKELRALCADAGLDAAESYGRILCPKKVPLAAGILNRAAERHPALGPVCLTRVLVLTPR